ncbi:LuxR family transcriptional regulator [Nocardiopsis sp. CNT-189]
MSDPRHNLPLSAAPIGRERDTADILRIVRNSRSVSLVGAGGIGKTLLAVRVAEAALPHFEHGARFVDLSRASTPEQATAAIGHALGIPESSDASAAEAVAMALRSRSVLLLLDTCEHLTPALGGLCEELLAACPRLHILATGREPLRVGREVVWRVPPLALPPAAPSPSGGPRPEPARSPGEALRHEAVRLFVERATAARPGFRLTPGNTEAVLRICRMLEGVPLALELAAARIRVLSAEQVLERLDDRFRLLAAGADGLPPRQRTMRAALEWSHDLLAPEERVLFRRLAVFCVWTADKVAPVCGFRGLAAGSAERAHAALVDKSLITADTHEDGAVTYRMTETVRAFAAERLAEAGEEDEVWRRMLTTAAPYLEGLASRLTGRVDWEERMFSIRMLDRCLENTLQMLDRAVPLGLVQEGLRICVALRFHWFVRGLQAQARSRLDRLLAVPAARTPVRARAAAVRSELLLPLAGPRGAACAAEDAVQTAVACDDDPAQGIAHTALAMASLRLGDGAAALRHGRRALRLAIASGERLTEICSLGALSQIARSRGDFDSSEVFLTRGIAIGQEMGDRWCVARCLNALGVVSTRRGDMEAAARQLGEALNVFVEMELLPDIARCTAGLGYLDLARGDVSGARRRLSSCLRLSIASGRRLAVARALEALGGLAAAEEQPERAASLAGAGAALRASLGLAAPHAEALRAEAAAVLSEEAAEEAWNAWRALPLEQVVERALFFPAPRRALPSLLTRREREISVLVSKGLSNREIAERLTISQATAARHIANIFRKLLFTSRTQLAEWVQRNGLAP